MEAAEKRSSDDTIVYFTDSLVIEVISVLFPHIKQYEPKIVKCSTELRDINEYVEDSIKFKSLFFEHKTLLADLQMQNKKGKLAVKGQIEIMLKIDDEKDVPDCEQIMKSLRT